jgi:hypothetical protein
MNKKSGTEISLLLATIIVGTVMFSGCNEQAKRDALISDAEVDVEQTISNFAYESFEITYDMTFTHDEKTYYFYDITVHFADGLYSEENVDCAYQLMWYALTALTNADFHLNYYTEASIIFRQYATYEGETYNIKTLDKYVLERANDYSFEYVTSTLKKIDLPYEGMSRDLIDHTELGKHYDYKSVKKTSAQKNYWIRTYYFLSSDGKTKYIVTCKDDVVTHVGTAKVRNNSGGSGSSKGNGYNASDYSNAEDFYYDHYDDFYDYEEAEDYYNTHK